MWWAFGTGAAGEYLSGYLIEESLSIDNVFVWALILAYFAVPRQYQHRVLFWGIFGALILRATFIFAGVALIERFELILFFFGAFLLYTAWKLVTSDDQMVDPDNEPDPEGRAPRRPLDDRVRRAEAVHEGRRAACWRRRCSPSCCSSRRPTWCSPSTRCRRCWPSATSSSSSSRRTRSPSSACGRSYFLLAGMHARFSYLQQGLAVILAFVGVKMILSRWVHIHDVDLAARHRHRARDLGAGLAAGRAAPGRHPLRRGAAAAVPGALNAPERLPASRR